MSLVESGFNVGWTEPFGKVLEQYFVITNNIRSLIEPYVVPHLRMIASVLNVNFSLGPNWTDILLLMMVYLGSRVKAYASDAKYIRTVFMAFVALAISLTSACFGSTTDLRGWQDAFVVSSLPLLGFLFYDVVYASVGAALDRRARESWWSDFIRHLWFSVPLLVLCISANFFLTISFTAILGASSYQTFILVFLIDYMVIALYWALKSFEHARKRENRNLGESARDRFWRSSATIVSLNIAVVIVSAAVFMLGNGGLKGAGAEFSHFQK